MSKHETWRTRLYWQKVGGLLVEEFIAVPRTKDQGPRYIDGVIVLGEEKKIHDKNFFDIKGKEVICVQTKKNRLGMNLMGQGLFTVELLLKYQPKSIKSVVICSKIDLTLLPICEKYDIEVVVIPQ